MGIFYPCEALFLRGSLLLGENELSLARMQELQPLTNFEFLDRAIVLQLLDSILLASDSPRRGSRSVPAGRDLPALLHQSGHTIGSAKGDKRVSAHDCERNKIPCLTE